MSELPDPDSPTLIEDIREQMDAKAAAKRGELWEKMGCPCAKAHMSEKEYLQTYRGRQWFCNPQVFEQASLALNTILCPKCVEKQDYGAVTGTRLYIQVEDDVMTVFKAVGHFMCHHCGFEEYHPLKRDPRVAAPDFSQVEQRYNAVMGASGMANHAMGLHSHTLAQMNAAMANQQAKQVYNQLAAQAAQMPSGPVPGMTQDEREALTRLYQSVHSQATAPPPIVQSREEAELLLLQAPPERRKSIIEKLRALGKI